jgi:arylsulfatase A-like enzyme
MTSQRAPNILFLFTDQQRHDWVGMNPDVPVRTPNLDRLADRGVEFTNAVCPSPICGPSRTCLVSGYEYHHVNGRSYDPERFPVSEYPTYAGFLRDDAGYHTLGAGKFLHGQAGDWGLDGKNRVGEFGYVDGVNSHGAGSGWQGTPGEPEDPYQSYLEAEGLAELHYEDFEDRQRGGPEFTTTRPTPLPEPAYIDNWIPRTGLELLEDAPDDKPWHLQVSFAGPHDPVDVTEEMHDWYRDPDVEFPTPVDPGDELTREKHQEIRRNYAAMIENTDRWLGRYLDALEERGERENTLVVFSSDHGEMLGDHALWKKNSPRQPSIGVPLVVAGPGVADRDPVDAPATILDLHATFLDYAGVAREGIDSRSLRPVLRGDEDATRDVVVSSLNPWRVVFDGRYKLVTGYDTDPDVEYPRWKGDKDQFTAFLESDRTLEEEQAAHDPILWDLAADPDETENVADQHPETVERLAEHLPDVAPGVVR